MSADNFIPIGPGVERIRDDFRLFPMLRTDFSSDNFQGRKKFEDFDKIKSGTVYYRHSIGS